MDTSKQYYKMCKAAEPIQEKGKEFLEENGDEPPKKQYWVIKEGEEEEEDEIVWLPRQDDLQLHFLDHGVAVEFRNIVKSMIEDNHIGRTIRQNGFIYSWEQLWLCMVMRMEYGKIWNTKLEKWEVI